MPKQTKLKRVSESQLNKDIYDAGEDDRFKEQPDPGRGMTRASQDVMQRRKIIKVSRRKFGGASGAAPSAPKASPASSKPTASKPAASSNPFASTTLAAQPKTAMSSSPASGAKSTPPKSNPFANIAFASDSTSSATASAPKPSFSFGSSATTSAPKPAASMTGFSFGGNNASSSMTTTSATAPKTSLSLSTPSKGKNERVKQLNQNLFHMIVDHWEGKMITQDYSHFLKEYQQHEDTLTSEDGGDSSNANDAKAGTSGSGGLASTSNGNSQPASLSFGAPAPAPAAKPFSSFAAAPAPAGAFSFGGKPATTAGASAAPSFSFGASAPAAGASSAPSFSFGSAPSSSTPTFANAPSATTTNSSGGNDDDPTSNPDDGKIEKIEAEENTEEEILYEVRAKHMKRENKQWKKFGAGVLRLYRHKTTSKCHMVIRNAIGKVQFNVGVSKGMTFEKVIKDTKKGKVAYVKFLAMESTEKGLEAFMLQVKPESVDKLHTTLEGMVA